MNLFLQKITSYYYLSVLGSNILIISLLASFGSVSWFTSLGCGVMNALIFMNKVIALSGFCSTLDLHFSLIT